MTDLESPVRCRFSLSWGNHQSTIAALRSCVRKAHGLPAGKACGPRAAIFG